MFSIFGKYSCDSPELVRQALLIHVNENQTYYEHVAKEYLSLIDTNLQDWLEDMSDVLTFGDELCLYALCRIYNRHCIVFTKTKAWSTILPCVPTTFNASLNMCDLYLLYMGRGIFGRLHKKILIEVRTGKVTDPRITVKIDRRFRYPPLINLKQPINTFELCDGDDYSNTDGKYIPCEHVSENSTCTRDKSDTETDTDESIGSLHVNLDSSYQYSMNETDAESFHADTSPGVCPVHGVPTPLPEIEWDNRDTDPITTVETDTDLPAKPIMNDENVPCLLDLVKTFLLSADYPHDIDMDMITRFCNVPLRRLIVNVNCQTEPEQENDNQQTAPVVKLLDCVVKLQKLNVTTIDETPSTDYDSDDTIILDPQTEDLPVHDNTKNIETNNELEDPLIKNIVRGSRPKRKVAENKTYAASSDSDNNTDQDAIMTSPKPKPRRKPPVPSEPSLSWIAAQKSTRHNRVKREKADTPNLSPDDESNHKNTDSKHDNNIIVPPKLRPRNTKEKHRNKPKVKSSPKTEPVIHERGKPTKIVKKGGLNLEFKGLQKHNKPRNFTCKVCEFTCETQAGLNSHHIGNHDPVTCSKCSKSFSTPSTLSRHMYSHGTLKFACDKCSNSYAFSSALERHSYSHRRYPAFKCHFKNCDRSYFSRDELQKHVKVHDGKLWSCPEKGCSYTNLDKRLIKPHMRKHSADKPYKCELCQERFTYHIQQHVTLTIKNVKNSKTENLVN